jgi:hypothetical protein
LGEIAKKCQKVPKK